MGHKNFWTKTKKYGNKFLKTVDRAAALGHKVAHAATDVGGGVAAFGAATAQPEIAAAGAALAGAGMMGTGAVKAYRGIRKGDKATAVGGAMEAHSAHARRHKSKTTIGIILFLL